VKAVTRPELAVRSSSRIELWPLSIASDGADFLVGRRGGGYLAVSPVGLEAISLLGEGLPVGRVKACLAAKHATDTVVLEPLLQQLMSAGLLRAVDDRRIERRTAARRTRQPWLSGERLGWLFGRRAIVGYVSLVALAILAVLSDPRVLPPPRLLLDAGWRTGLLALAVTAIVAAKHEFAHIAAGRFLGADPRCRLGYRLFFPVIETDLSDLWLVPARRRYLAYAAGVASDVLLACLAMVALWAHVRGWIPLPPGLRQALEITVLIVGCVIVWQLNVFLRTDGYFMLANALGCRNLAGDAKAYLRRLMRRERDRVTAPAVVRLYAMGYAVNAAALSAVGVFGLLAVAFGPTAGSGRWISLPITLALLGFAIAAQRKRTRLRYRLRCPPGL
jgi:hypothetical protein